MCSLPYCCIVVSNEAERERKDKMTTVHSYQNKFGNTATVSQIQMIQTLLSTQTISPDFVKLIRELWISGSMNRVIANNVIRTLKTFPENTNSFFEGDNKNLEGFHNVNGRVFLIRYSKSGSKKLYGYEIHTNGTKTYSPEIVNYISEQTMI